MEIDAVFEGGGVKGIGLVGALAVAEERGYRLAHLAGTSAGAVVAALAAAGYSAAQLKGILDQVDYRKFKDRGAVDRIPGLGKTLSVLLQQGIYEGDYFAAWLGRLLADAPHPVKTFADLRTADEAPRYRYRLQVIASDITRGRLLVLPGDIAAYGYDPDRMSVVEAVRMSMSIPLFFEPVKLRDRQRGGVSHILDGGILSNFPVWIFDDGHPERQTIGFKLVEPDEGRPQTINNPLDFLTALLSTMMEAHDARYLENASFVRTVTIPTLGVHTVDFHLTPERREALYQSGRRAAEDFFRHWSPDAFVQRYQNVKAPHRRETV